MTELVPCPKICQPCRDTGAVHCSDPENCGGPWDKRFDPVKRDGSVADIADTELLRRAVHSAIRKRRREPAWSMVAQAFGLGSTYAAQLCRRFERDPDTGKELESKP